MVEHHGTCGRDMYNNGTKKILVKIFTPVSFELSLYSCIEMSVEYNSTVQSRQSHGEVGGCQSLTHPQIQQIEKRGNKWIKT